VSVSVSAWYFNLQFLLQSYELVKSISRTNGVPAKEFVWALKADVQSTTEIARLFRYRRCALACYILRLCVCARALSKCVLHFLLSL